MPSVAYVLVFIFAAKVKKVSHELEMSRVGKRVQERGRKEVHRRGGWSNSELVGSGNRRGFCWEGRMQAGISEELGGCSCKDVEEGLGQDGEGGALSRYGDRQGGCAGRWGDWAGEEGAGRTETASTAETRRLHAPPGLRAHRGGKQAALIWASGEVEEVETDAWGHQHPGGHGRQGPGRDQSQWRLQP